MISKQIKFLFGAACVAAAFAGSASAATTTVSLVGSNTDIRTYTDGGAYNALYDSSRTLAGVQFDFAALDGQTAITGGPITINTSIANPGTVYTLVNSAFGAYGADAGSITFNATGGLSYTLHYIEGDNIRDHYFGSFVNTTSSSSVTQAVWGVNAPGNAHLDMQTIVLPDAFHSQTLTSVVFDSHDRGGEGIAFLAGLSVAAVPEPSQYAMLGLGLGLLAVAARRRSRS